MPTLFQQLNRRCVCARYKEIPFVSPWLILVNVAPILNVGLNISRGAVAAQAIRIESFVVLNEVLFFIHRQSETSDRAQDDSEEGAQRGRGGGESERLGCRA